MDYTLPHKLMFDFVKMTIKGEWYARSLQNNKLLKFTTAVDTKTGELKDGIYKCKYHNFKFTIYPSHLIEISGSLHKYWNLGTSNYDDYSFQSVQNTIADLEEKFNIDPSRVEIHNLEIGLNIVTPFNPTCFLDKLIVFKNLPFNRMKVIKKGCGREANFSQYSIKIYNKSLQYSLPDNILRFEKKIIKMAKLKKAMFI